jgi:hypothetical protein
MDVALRPMMLISPCLSLLRAFRATLGEGVNRATLRSREGEEPHIYLTARLHEATKFLFLHHRLYGIG